MLPVMSVHFCVFQTSLPHGIHSRSCTCSADRCNSKDHVMRFVSEASVTTRRPVMVSMHNPLWDRKRRWWTSSDFRSIAVPCVVILIGLLLVLLAVVVVVRMRRYRRRVQPYTYAQLTADLSVESA